MNGEFSRFSEGQLIKVKYFISPQDLFCVTYSRKTRFMLV
jgi:hypothetical protein